MTGRVVHSATRGTRKCDVGVQRAMSTMWDAPDDGHGFVPFGTEPSAYEQHMQTEREKRQLASGEHSAVDRVGRKAHRLFQTEADNLKTARIYLLWGKPDSNGLCPLYYCGSSRQTRKQRFYGHKRAARCDPLKSPLHRFAHAENETDPMSGWTCTQLCEFEYDAVLCADARVLMEQYFIESLRAAGYKDMLMRNNALCKDTRRRAQMARLRAQHL